MDSHPLGRGAGRPTYTAAGSILFAKSRDVFAVGYRHSVPVLDKGSASCIDR
jgi:hypothetical protein